MEHEEFLERLFSETFKREADESENVARTLPFFATSLAIVVTILGYAAQHLRHLDGNIFRGASYPLLAGAATAIAGVLWALLRAVWPRSYRLLPPETELLAYAESLHEFYVQAGTPNPSATTRSDLRSFVVRELAHAAAENRSNNAKRVGARTQAFVSLMFALTCAFVLGAFIFLTDDADADQPKGMRPSGPTARPTAYAPAASAAGPPATAKAPLPNRGR